MADTRVLVVDDHALFRESLRKMLDDVEGIEVVGEAGEGVEAIAKTVQMMPEVVLMDIAIPNVNGLEATRQIKKQCPGVRVIILSMYEDRQYVREMVEAGAAGYILKKAPSKDLISAVKAVSADQAFLDPSIAQKMLDGYNKEIRSGSKEEKNRELTNRERQIICLVATGKTNLQISESLGIALRTVQAHRLSIMRKLNVHDRTEVVRYAIREGLVEP